MSEKPFVEDLGDGKQKIKLSDYTVALFKRWDYEIKPGEPINSVYVKFMDAATKEFSVLHHTCSAIQKDLDALAEVARNLNHVVSIMKEVKDQNSQ